MTIWFFLRTVDMEPDRFILLKEPGIDFSGTGVDPFNLTNEDRTKLVTVKCAKSMTHEGFFLTMLENSRDCLKGYTEIKNLNSQLFKSDDKFSFYDDLLERYPLVWSAVAKSEKPIGKTWGGGDGSHCGQQQASTRSGLEYIKPHCVGNDKAPGGAGGGRGRDEPNAGSPEGSGAGSGGDGNGGGGNGGDGNGGDGNGGDGNGEKDDKASKSISSDDEEESSDQEDISGASDDDQDPDFKVKKKEKIALKRKAEDPEVDREKKKKKKFDPPPEALQKSNKVDGGASSSSSSAQSAAEKPHRREQLVSEQNSPDEASRDFAKDTKKKRKKELYRPSRNYLAERRRYEGKAVGVEKNLYAFSTILYDERTRHLDKISEELVALREMTREVITVTHEVKERLRRIESAGTDNSGLDSLEASLNIPWKSCEDIIYACTRRSKDLKRFCHEIYPQDEPSYVAKLCQKLFDQDFSKTLLYTAPRSGGAGEVQVKMGKELTKMPNCFADFMYGRIQINKYLPLKQAEHKKLARFFENQVRRMREEEIVGRFLTAVDGDGMASDVCTILIINDLCQNCGGITERKPDLSDRDEMRPWLLRHKAPVLQAVAKAKHIVNVNNLSNQELIEKCLRNRQSMAHLRKCAEKLKSGEQRAASMSILGELEEEGKKIIYFFHAT